MSKSSKNKQQLTENQKQELKGFAEQVNLLQTAIISNDKFAVRYGKKSLELAIQAGNFLRKAKKLAGHGNWGRWVMDNVPSISKKTLENYMRVAEEAEVNASFLTGVESLRQAYKRVGICHEKPKTEAAHADQTNQGPGESTSPATMKENDKAQYDAKRNEVRQNAIAYARKTISDASKVNWKLSTWTVKNDQPCSDEEVNYGAALFEDLKEWVAKREYKALRHEDEISTKTGVLLNEVVKSFILANTATGTTNSLAQVAPDFVMEVNAQLAEVTEPMAA